MSNKDLEEYFKFDESDLYANHNGRLSEKQQQNMVRDAKTWKVAGTGCGLFFFAIASIFPFIFAPQILNPTDGTNELIGLIIGVLAWVAVWGTVGVLILRSAHKKTNFTVRKAEGPVNIVGVERRTSGKNSHKYIAHELHIGGYKFDVGSDLASLVMQGDVYSVYYLEDTNAILSLELVSSRE